MAGLKETRKRINSVKNTQKITKAMKMVAASKLRRAQIAMMNIRKYSNEMRLMAGTLVGKVEHIHPLLIKRPQIKNEAVIVVSGDKGLCGSFNASIVRYTKKFIETRKKEGVNLTLFFVGKKASESLRSVDVEKNNNFIHTLADLQFEGMYEFVEVLLEGYVSGKYDLITVIYNRFKSAVTQEVSTEQIFPLHEDAFTEEENIKDRAGRDLVIEPTPKEVLDFIVPRYAATELYHDFMESIASELSARMNAMDSASRNATDMIYKLTLIYNKARQNAITKELMEIVGGAEALKG